MTYSLSHLSDSALLKELEVLVTQDRDNTATLLAHIAEADARKLYVPAGYRSMYAYCVEHLRLSEDAAYKRIQAARVARQFPEVFTALADGRLHLSGVVLLAPYLTTGNAKELLDRAAMMTKGQIEELIAARFPTSEALPLVVALAPGPEPQLAPGQVGGGVDGHSIEAPNSDQAPHSTGASDDQLAPGQVGVPRSPGRIAPVAFERFALHLTMGKVTHDKLRHAQDLLSHQIPRGDLASVLDRALDALILRLEKRKLAATDRPRSARRASRDPRHIPAHVRRTVWERDGGRCTFVSESGHRCESRELIEFDHVEPVAMGGQPTVNGIRLRCHAHNQYGAEQAFGGEFMKQRREEGRA